MPARLVGKFQTQAELDLAVKQKFQDGITGEESTMETLRKLGL
jgi:hypothetical protein